MKTIKVSILLSILIIIILSCSKNKDSGIHNNTNQIELSKTEYKGCFLEAGLNSTKNTRYDTGDSLYYTLVNDTLLLHVIMNYNCCGSLRDSLAFDDENVSIYICDTCIIHCICYCMCVYEFEYSFTNFSGNNIHFYVYLKGFEEDEYSLWNDLEYNGKSQVKFIIN